MIPITALEILAFIVTTAARTSVSWVTSKVLSEIFGDGSPDVEVLEEIQQNQKLILEKIEDILSEIDWESLTLAAYPAETSITQKYFELCSIARASDPEEQRARAETLSDAILDGNQGLKTNLFQINEIILGTNSISQNQSLLKQFTQRNLSHLRSNHRSGSLLSVYRSAESYLSCLFHLQFMGLDLLVNALMARGHTHEALEATDLLRCNLEKQMQEFKDSMPELMHQVGENGRFKCVLRNVKYKSDGFLYGNPVNTGRMRGVLQSRDRHPGNQDEEWVFSVLPNSRFFQWKQVSSQSLVRIVKRKDSTNAQVKHDGGDRDYQWVGKSQWQLIPMKDGSYLIENEHCQHMIAPSVLVDGTVKTPKESSAAHWLIKLI